MKRRVGAVLRGDDEEKVMFKERDGEWLRVPEVIGDESYTKTF